MAERTKAEPFSEMTATRNLATKQDIAEVRHEIDNVKRDLEIALANTKHDILKWVITAMIAQTAVLIGIVAFLKG